MVELAVEPQPGWSIDSARDATSAIEVLRNTPVDVILSERNLPDMTGLQFHRRLMQESRLKSLPFIFLSIDSKLEHKVVALRSGADDYLVKPIAAAELLARVESHVGRWRRARELVRGRRYLLAGDFSALPFPDLISTLALQRRTGSVSINTPSAMAEIHLEAGLVIHAVYGNLIGAPAFNALFLEESAQFEFTPNGPPLPPEQRSIFDSVTGLIMEATRLIDEQGRLPLPRPVVSAALPEVAPEEKHPSRRLAPVFAAAIGDQFALGELFLWTGSELGTWLRRDFPERLHVHLITDLSIGLSAILPLAAPPNERQMLATLRPGSKLPGLVYFLRNERLFDVVVVDIEAPLTESHHLRRSPTITIIAPRLGDALEIGPRSMAGIKTLLGLRPPQLVVGVGNASMAGFFENALDPSLRRVLLSGSLGEGQTETREVLTRALESWGVEP
jgi:CheY-like chemotaxis protein